MIGQESRGLDAMRRGLIFPGGGMTMADICALAQEAEQKGLDSLYCVEAWRERVRAPRRHCDRHRARAHRKLCPQRLRARLRS